MYYRIEFRRENRDLVMHEKSFSTLRDINYFLDDNMWLFVHGDITIVEVEELKTVTEKNYEDQL